MSTFLLGYAASHLVSATGPARCGLSRNDRASDRVASLSPADLLEEFERDFGRMGVTERLVQTGLAACPSGILLVLFLWS